MKFGALILVFWFVSAHAAPTCERLEKNWNKYYFEDFGVTWPKTGSFDCPGGEAKFAEALFYLHRPVLEKATPTSPKPPSFYSYAKKHIVNTRYQSDCAYVAGARDGLLTLCPRFFKKSAEYRASTIFHEARHLAPNDPDHVACVRGVYPICDEKLSDDSTGSGFNYDLVYLTWVLNGSSSHDLSKWVLQSEINALVPDRFNEVSEQDIKKWRQEPSQ